MGRVIRTPDGFTASTCDYCNMIAAYFHRDPHGESRTCKSAFHREWVTRGLKPLPPYLGIWVFPSRRRVLFDATELRAGTEGFPPYFREMYLVAADAIEAGEDERAACILTGLGMLWESPP